MDYNKLKNDADVRSIFIAEAGINHDGSLATAKQMVNEAVKAGADYVKFQSFKAEKFRQVNAFMFQKRLLDFHLDVRFFELRIKKEPYYLAGHKKSQKEQKHIYC